MAFGILYYAQVIPLKSNKLHLSSVFQTNIDLEKMTETHQNRFKINFHTSFFYIINGLCQAFVVWQSIKCATKYIQKPLGTVVSLKKSSDVPFPAVTVCGSFGKSQAGSTKGFNYTYLQEVCNLRLIFYVLH